MKNLSGILADFFMVDDAKSGVLGGVAVFAIVTYEPRGF